MFHNVGHHLDMDHQGVKALAHTDRSYLVGQERRCTSKL